MKCELCKKEIEETFLKKIVGTVVKDKKGKKHYVCAACQNKFKNDKEKMIESI